MNSDGREPKRFLRVTSPTAVCRKHELTAIIFWKITNLQIFRNVRGNRNGIINFFFRSHNIVANLFQSFIQISGIFIENWITLSL